jgi:S-adenosylmethionine synthetase
VFWLIVKNGGEELLISEELKIAPVDQQRVELVERKGAGHPDSLCNAIMQFDKQLI